MCRSAKTVLNARDSSAFHKMMIFIDFCAFFSSDELKVFVDW